MNILFAGTPHPSAKILKALSDKPSINIVGVLTKPDSAQKRGRKLVQSPVSIAAKDRNLNIFKPDDLNTIKFKHSIEALSVDFIVVAAYGKILPKWL